MMLRCAYTTPDILCKQQDNLRCGLGARSTSITSESWAQHYQECGVQKIWKEKCRLVGPPSKELMGFKLDDGHSGTMTIP